MATGDLRVGENLLLADDTTRQLLSSTLRPTRETVYNIEVDGEHVFCIDNDGVLGHNRCHNPGTAAGASHLDTGSRAGGQSAGRTDRFVKVPPDDSSRKSV